MIRLLLVLVIIGLGLLLVSRGLNRVEAPADDSAGSEARTAIQEAEQVKALLEQQQGRLRERSDAARDR